MESAGQSRPSWVRALIVAGADPHDADEVDLAIIRNITCLSFCFAGVVFGSLFYAAGVIFVAYAVAFAALMSGLSTVLCVRGHGFWGAALMVVAMNFCIVVAAAERGPGQLEVVHICGISLPLTLFPPRQWWAIVVSLGVGLAGVGVVQLLFLSSLLSWPPPEGPVRLFGTMGSCVLVAGQFYGYFLVRNGALGRLNEALTQAYRADEAKNAFLANISHEIRTPMNGVLGMLGMLRESSLGGEQQQRVEVAHASAVGLLPVIEQLLHPDRLDLTRASGSFDTLESGVHRQPPERDTSSDSGVVEKSAEPAEPSAVPRVLVVDDNMINLKVVERMLTRLGCDVDLAGGGQEAVDRVERAPYDLVLMDVQMPQMDGLEACGRIRQREQEGEQTHHVPIVALTAHAMEADRERCLAAGMDDYLSKPVSREQLGALVARLCDHVSPRSESTT
ncbi:MAG: response regulator [Myxococcota bacterium]